MLNELISLAEGHELTVLGVIAIALSGVVQVSKVQLNPWSAVGRLLLIPVTKIRDMMIAPLLNEFVALNTRVIRLSEEIEALNQEQMNTKKRDREKTKSTLRRSILRFGDECRIRQKHSKEMFDNALTDISDYERLVNLTSDPNGVLTGAIEIINEAYSKCLRDNDFL